jgi:hypothetical protein
VTDNYIGSSAEALDILKAIGERDRLISEMRMLLMDAGRMLSDIERNRQMPPQAATLQQYVALGRDIRAFLTYFEKDDVDEPRA